MRRLIPILFKVDMVQSMLDDRKLQTSRLNERWGKVNPGDLLWVRENFCECGQYSYMGSWNRSEDHRVVYKTEEQPQPFERFIWRNKPCIHLPKADCRMLLEVISVEKRKLQSITEQEAIDEGIGEFPMDGKTYYINYMARDICPIKSPIESFQTLWDSINAKKEGCSWNDNPDVWMVKYKILSKTLDETQKLIKEMV